MIGDVKKLSPGDLILITRTSAADNWRGTFLYETNSPHLKIGAIQFGETVLFLSQVKDYRPGTIDCLDPSLWINVLTSLGKGVMHVARMTKV